MLTPAIPFRIYKDSAAVNGYVATTTKMAVIMILYLPPTSSAMLLEGRFVLAKVRCLGPLLRGKKQEIAG